MSNNLELMDDEPTSLMLEELEKELALIEGVAPVQVGRPIRPFGAQDMAPAINQYPVTVAERRHTFLAMKRDGYSIPVNLQLEFSTYSGDDSGYSLTEDGQLEYADTPSTEELSVFNQW